MGPLFKEEMALFPTDLPAIRERIARIKPVKYGKTRNFINGDVTYLSPYISRGVISTKFVLEEVLSRGFAPSDIEKFIQELAWRDYWQQVWIARKEAINTDLKRPQEPVVSHGIPTAILQGNTGIHAIDKAIADFYETGYLHNHVRMYIASIACNVAQCHWRLPAQWMYYHLLDGDWASNALSWQWVAGANSHKKYYANQKNINKYCFTDQRGTFLDVSYDAFESLAVPEVLRPTEIPDLQTPLPNSESISIDPDLPTLIYNSYNLDPHWKKAFQANRILLFEPSVFEAYPVSGKTLKFVLDLAKNIQGIQVYTGEFDEFVQTYSPQNIHFKEHPLNRHYQGFSESRDWMFSVEGYFPSFFSFWKKCRKELNWK